MLREPGALARGPPGLRSEPWSISASDVPPYNTTVVVARHASKRKEVRTLATPARSWIGGIVLVGLLGYLGYTVWSRFSGGLRVGGPARELESRWRTEEEWIIDSIALDLAEMSVFAGTGRPPTPKGVAVLVTPTPLEGPRRIEVTLPGGQKVEQTLELATFIWSPTEFTALARDLLKTLGACAAPRSEPAEPAPNLLQVLTDPLPLTIEQANQIASKGLRERICAPASHEVAALVLSAFALREAAWFYTDTRATLSRITAHLAFAASLRHDALYGREGRFALATLLILAGRGAEAAEALDRLEAEGDLSPEATAWRRALRLRLTDDTRGPGTPATLLERRELYRSRLQTLGVSKALDYVEELGPEEIADWWRIASSADLSVETGNVFLATALERELAEIREVATLSRGTPISSDRDLVAALNQPAERCLTAQGPRAIGWGTWAAFLERHLLHVLLRRHDHARRFLGLPTQADAGLQEAAQRFGKLVHYPLLEVRTTLEARRRPQRFDELVELVARRPEIFPVFEWFYLGEMAHYELVRHTMPTIAAWFRPALPRGTTYDVKTRLAAHLVATAPDSLRSLHAISPLNYAASEQLARVEFKEQPSLPALEKVFGPRAQYDLRALSLMAELIVRDLEPYGRLLERTCELSVDECFDRGLFLVETGRFAEAAAAYQRAMDEASNRVRAANNSLWLMNYYLDAGQAARARAVAEDAAATGSYGGLLTQARFLERTGDFDAAESILQDAMRRYGNEPKNPDEEWEAQDGEQDADNLLVFYYRLAIEQKKAAYAERFHALADRDFPNGIERLDRASLRGRPVDGVSVLKTWPIAERRGMKAGDIIVGLDGIRVRTRRQYFVVTDFTDRPEMALVVFRHPDYVDVKARVPWRRLGMDLRSNGAGNAQRAP